MTAAFAAISLALCRPCPMGEISEPLRRRSFPHASSSPMSQAFSKNRYFIKNFHVMNLIPSQDGKPAWPVNSVELKKGE